MNNFLSYRTLIVSLVLLSMLSIFITPFIGDADLDITSIFSSSMDHTIFFQLRLPRIIFSFFVGFSLALVGTMFQALLRNDLATPYTLGVSSGGSLGAVLAMKSGLIINVLGYSTVTIFSIIGSISTIFIIYLIARSRSTVSPLTLILSGVTISLLFSSIILFIHYLADFTETYRMIRWIMGGLQITGWQYNLSLIPLCMIAFFYFYYQANALNILSAGYDIALSKGVDVIQLQKVVFFGGSIIIGFVVAFAGPIGFIGLIVPHLMRLIVGADHRKLLLVAPVFGGLFLIWCDTLARTLIAPAELPVGVITSMLGGPFFIWLLIKKKR